MLKVFVGDDRVRIAATIQKLADESGVIPEKVNAETLQRSDLPNIFFGSTLFSVKRLVVVKDFSENAKIWNALVDFLPDAAKNTNITVALFEKTLDKRTYIYKQLKDYAEIYEMVLAKVDERAVFRVFGLALSGEHEAALQIIDRIRHQNEPQMFFGLLVSQVANLAALIFSDKPSAMVAKDVGVHAFALGQLERYRKEFSKAEMRKMLQQFLETDKAMKSSPPADVWVLIKNLILQISWR
ncbi:MAG: hypothetical protein LBE03_00145 [Candidatus Nomurabacteria bacterium]|jgi:DNA polymerase III delta subunit|nr:hypothetical protein [Candidatus Nomurabacteria bacterium]